MTSNILAIDGRTPSVSSDAWVAPTATGFGSVTIGAGTGVFYGAGIRAEMEDITIGEGSNIQDSAVVRADPGYRHRSETMSAWGRSRVARLHHR